MRILIKAKPGAKRTEIKEVAMRQFTVAVREPAQDGKANHAIEKAIAEYFNVAPARVRIISGFTSREKMIEILD